MSSKIIVPIDLKNPSKIISDILYPKLIEDEVSLVSIKKPKKWEYGMVVLMGGELTEKDLFTKVIDSKVKIDSVETFFGSSGYCVEISMI